MHSTKQVFMFILVLTLSVATAITGLREATKDQAALNESIFNKRALLKALQPKLDSSVDDMSDDEVLTLFDSKVEQIVLDMEGNVLSVEQVEASGHKGGKAENVDLAKEKKKPEASRILPFYVFDDGKTKSYILSVRGSGLWDDIWGALAIESDLETVIGATFDHKGETPGLGAEIKDNKAFIAQFQGKKLTNEAGDYVYITVRKGGARDQRTEVDGITGATVTADGVTEMLKRGLHYYQPYLKGLK